MPHEGEEKTLPEKERRESSYQKRERETPTRERKTNCTKFDYHYTLLVSSTRCRDIAI